MEQLKQKIPAQVYESLLNANIKSLTRIIRSSKVELAQITCLDLSAVEEVFKNTAAIILSANVLSASVLQKWRRISLGCPSLDVITEGGVSVDGISEIVGCSGVGKTQICMQLAITAQLPRNVGGLAKSVVYICTEDVFPVKRFVQLAEAFSDKHNEVKICFEDNVLIDHIADIEQLKRCLFNNLPKLLAVKPVGLVVIDSIAGIFRSENQNVNYSNRRQEFVSIAAKLNKLSEKYGFATVCTNQVTDNLSTGATEPCLGLAWSNIVTSRYSIKRFHESKIREFEIVFAPDLPNATCKFLISQEGITSID